MTVNELVERLQEVADDGLGECEVRLATQPSWPLQYSVGGIATPDDTVEVPETPVIYLVEGNPIHESPYAPDWAFTTAK